MTDERMQKRVDEWKVDETWLAKLEADKAAELAWAAKAIKDAEASRIAWVAEATRVAEAARAAKSA